MQKTVELPGHLALYDSVAPAYRTGKKLRTRRWRRYQHPKLSQARSYVVDGVHKVPKDMARAMRRHPPTTCRTCGEQLVWSFDDARYVPELQDCYEAAIAACPRPARKGRFHTPANGKKSHRFDGHQGAAL
jgi:hypothetical protein